MLWVPISQAGAEERLAERVGKGEAPIHEDNLERAKTRAIVFARRQAVKNLLEELLAKEWIALYNSEIYKQILSKADRFIGSFRVREVETSMDRTRFFAEVSAQIDREAVTHELKALSLPIRGEPLAPAGIFFANDDPVLKKPKLRGKVFKALKKRLRLLNFKVIRTKGVTPEVAERFNQTAESPALRGRFLRRAQVSAGVFLSFSLQTKSEIPGEPPRAPEVKALLYQANTGLLLGNFSARTKKKLKLNRRNQRQFAREIQTHLVAPLLIKFQPGGVVEARGGGEEMPLKLRVIGLNSVEEEESFEQIFFHRNASFKNFQLHRLENNAVTWMGTYSKNRNLLEQKLRGKRMGGYKIKRVYWLKDTLELDVRRRRISSRPEIKPFPPSMRSVQVSKVMETFFLNNHGLGLEDASYSENEDNGWLERANPLPFDATVYGFVDSRGDSDFFILDGLRSGARIRISVYLMGKTNLTPAIRIFDKKGKPVKVFYPKVRVHSLYRVPRGQHSLYVEVGDRFGSLKWDSGGYMNYHYLLQVEPQRK